MRYASLAVFQLDSPFLDFDGRGGTGFYDATPIPKRREPLFLRRTIQLVTVGEVKVSAEESVSIPPPLADTSNQMWRRTK
jgi:hypothetical protein